MTTAIEFKPVSLLDRIKKAKTIDELTLLITEGESYEYAHCKTRAKWDKAYEARRLQILKEGEEKFEKMSKTPKKGSKKGGKRHDN